MLSTNEKTEPTDSSSLSFDKQETVHIPGHHYYGAFFHAFCLPISCIEKKLMLQCTLYAYVYIGEFCPFLEYFESSGSIIPKDDIIIGRLIYGIHG